MAEKADALTPDAGDVVIVGLQHDGTLVVIRWPRRGEGGGAIAWDAVCADVGAGRRFLKIQGATIEEAPR